MGLFEALCETGGCQSIENTESAERLYECGFWIFGKMHPKKAENGF